MAVVDLIHSCVKRFHQQRDENGNGRSSSSNNNPDVILMNNLHRESQELKRTLLVTYTGERLRRTFDWTLSLIDDDVSSFTKKLTVMEERLFRCSAAASHAFAMWKLHGSRRICVSETAMRAGIMMNMASNGSGNGNSNVNNGTGVTSKRSFSKSRMITSNDNHEGGPGDGKSNDMQFSNKRIRSY